MKKIYFLVLILFLGVRSEVVSLTVNFSSTKVCLGNETTLINRSTAPGDSIQYVMWDLNGDGKFDDAVTDTVTVTLSYSGSHEIGLKVITYGGDAKALYQLVYVGEVKSGFTFETGCMYQPISFQDQSEVIGDAVAGYYWDFGDGSLPAYEPNPVHQFSSAGTFSIKQLVTSLLGCKDSVIQTITIGNEVTVDLQFAGDTVFVKGDSVIAYLTSTYDSVRWSTGSTTSSIVIRTGGYYWVRVYVGSCFADKSFRIQVDEYGSEPVVMNLITPNGDGMNDQWKILNLEKIGPCDVSIYNRYGEKVFSNSEYINDWEGTYKGKSLPNDTYYYFVRCYNQDLVQGTVNILK